MRRINISEFLQHFVYATGTKIRTVDDISDILEEVYVVKLICVNLYTDY